MRKFWWMLAVPLCWGINNSSGTYIVGGPILQADAYSPQTEQWEFCMDHSEQWAKDLAAALNEAHKNRVREIPETSKEDLYWKDSKKADWDKGPPTQNGGAPPPLVTDKQACGQDDCGAEPK